MHLYAKLCLACKCGRGPTYKRTKCMLLSKLLSKHSLDGCKCMQSMHLAWIEAYTWAAPLGSMHLHPSYYPSQVLAKPTLTKLAKERAMPSSKWGRSPPPPSSERGPCPLVSGALPHLHAKQSLAYKCMFPRDQEASGLL